MIGALRSTTTLPALHKSPLACPTLPAPAPAAPAVPVTVRRARRGNAPWQTIYVDCRPGQFVHPHGIMASAIRCYVEASATPGPTAVSVRV